MKYILRTQGEIERYVLLNTPKVKTVNTSVINRHIEIDVKVSWWNKLWRSEKIKKSVIDLIEDKMMLGITFNVNII